MSTPRVRLNSAGIRAVLNGSGARTIVEAACEEIKTNVEAQSITVGDRDGGKHEYPLPVTTSIITTDRVHGSVALAHPAGQAVEAKHGALAKAAASAGLAVRGGGE